MKDVVIKPANKKLADVIIAAVNELGGIEKFTSRDDKVLLVPNFNTADPFPASTSMDFLEAVVKIFLEARPSELVVGGSSTYFANTRKVMEKIGMFDLEKIDPRIKAISFDENNWIKTTIPGAKFLKKASIPEAVGQADRIIFLPCLKTHFQAKYTGALKLAVGLMHPSERLSLHFSNIQEKIAELSTAINPDLIIMDARKCFVTNGPMSGETRRPDKILASSSRTAIDIAGIRIIQSFQGNDLEGVKPEQMAQIKRALELEL